MTPIVRRTFFLLLLLCFPSCLVRGDVLQISFQSRVVHIDGIVPAGVALGSSVTGLISIDLDTLPPDINSQPNRGWYRYDPPQPGFTISFDTGLLTRTYSSENASDASGLSPGIFVTDLAQFNGLDVGDIVSYQLQEVGNPSAISLSFVDDVSPYDMITSDAFPLSLNRDELTHAQLEWYDNVLAQTGFVANVDSFTFQVVPEPAASNLLFCAGAAAALLRARLRRYTVQNRAKTR